VINYMALAPGAMVTLKGLVGQPELNGSRGKLGVLIEETGRWRVALEGGAAVNAKPENLTLEIGVDFQDAKEAASFKPLLRAPTTMRLGSYYGTDPDNYKKARVVRDGEIKSTNFDHELYTEMSRCLNDGGKVTLSELTSKIWPLIADGRGGRQELTCNERWTIRYGLGEFNWQFGARVKLLKDMPTIDVLNLHGKKVTDKKQLEELLNGPSLEELNAPPAKKLKGGSTELIWVDGMFLNKLMLKAIKEAVGDDGVVDCYEAVKLFSAAATGGELTCCERWTLRFILSSCMFTDAAFDFIKEALAERPGKIKYTDSLES